MEAVLCDVSVGVVVGVFVRGTLSDIDGSSEVVGGSVMESVACMENVDVVAFAEAVKYRVCEPTLDDLETGSDEEGIDVTVAV